MAVPEQLPWFGLDFAPKVELPKESMAPLPPATEASRLSVGVGADAGAQAMVKEAMPEDPLAQVGATARGGS
jgi:hypothetical protein